AAVAASCDDPGAVRAKRHLLNFAAVRERGRNWPACPCIPNARGFVVTGGGHSLSIGTECRVEHSFAMPQGWGHGLARECVPNSRRVVKTGCNNLPAIAAESRHRHRAQVSERRTDRFTRFRI